MARIDRRVARTRETLHHALMSLILRKDFDAITVQDIIDQANVGRSTFYAHYSGKEDLLRGGFERLRTRLEQVRAELPSANGGARRFGFSRAFFEHANEYSEIFRALVHGRGGQAALAEIRNVLGAMIRAERPAIRSEPGVPRDLYERFIVDAFISVLSWWLERRPTLEPGEVDRMFRRLTLCGDD
jgi:AcrR family transcriptional regulator